MRDNGIKAARIRQIERVNGPLDSEARLRGEIERLKAIIAKLERRNKELADALLDESPINPFFADDLAAAPDGTMTINKRSVIPLAEAQARAGVSQPTAWRYVAVSPQWWQGWQDSSGQWWVYADQEFTRRNRKRKK